MDAHGRILARETLARCGVWSRQLWGRTAHAPGAEPEHRKGDRHRGERLGAHGFVAGVSGRERAEPQSSLPRPHLERQMFR